MLRAGTHRSRRHSGRRAAVLLAAVAVPAFAAPQALSDLAGGLAPAFTVGDAAWGPTDVQPMPFEKAGDSFPGSAFYYLAPEAPSVPLDPEAHSDAFDARATDPWAGPAARSLRAAGSGTDRARALTCLTQAIYYEAASEPDGGQRAVAQVVLNRVAHPAYPKSVCGVVYQGSERTTGCQFSFTCDGALARVPSRLFWLRAESVARAALAGYVYAPVGLATHYHTIAVHPYWADKLNFLLTIGAHRFYRFGGPAGQPAAFSTAAYTGGEPLPAPRPHINGAAAPDPALDPVAIERAYAAGMIAAQTEAPAGLRPAALVPVRATTAPAYAPDVQARGGDAQFTARALPGSGAVKPEYAQSGRWIVPQAGPGE